MITIKVHSGEISVNGHAGYAEEGKDIVCAAVSTLVQTLIGSIEDLTEDKIEYCMQPGTVDIKWRNLSEKSKTLVDSFFVGIVMVSNEYPNNVKIL